MLGSGNRCMHSPARKRYNSHCERIASTHAVSPSCSMFSQGHDLFHLALGANGTILRKAIRSMKDIAFGLHISCLRDVRPRNQCALFV